MSAAIEIPYELEARPDTGFTNGRLGMWLFLASEVMLFGALFSSYAVLRMGAESWPVQSSIVSIPVALFNTVLLLISSFTMVKSGKLAEQGNLGGFRMFMGLTILLGLAFLCVKSYEYGLKFEHHLLPSTSVFIAIYFTMTGLHALHIIGGLVVNAYFFGPGAAMFKTDRKRFAGRIKVAAMYWNFVDIVWLFVFTVLYLL